MIRAIFTLLFAFALSAHAANPPLASLQIEIWPEYDRAAVLVIYKAALPAAARLPAELTFRIPASSGGPAAVAYSAEESGNLLNLSHQEEKAGNFILVHIRPPQRFVHLEFYEPIATGNPTREYRYAWPGDMAVERVSVLVKEPAQVSDLAVQPNFDLAGQGPDGLKQRTAEFGPLKSGEQLPIDIRYVKADPRPSTEILAAPAAVAELNAQPSQRPVWPLALVAGGAIVLLGAVAALFWRRRRVALTSAICATCGRPTTAGDRFCASCGTPLG